MCCFFWERGGMCCFFWERGGMCCFEPFLMHVSVLVGSGHTATAQRPTNTPAWASILLPAGLVWFLSNPPGWNEIERDRGKIETKIPINFCHFLRIDGVWVEPNMPSRGLASRKCGKFRPEAHPINPAWSLSMLYVRSKIVLFSNCSAPLKKCIPSDPY